jgi:SAM-dependent methyltransferase
MAEEMTTVERLLAVWEHLELEAAHVATQMAADVAELVAKHPNRVAGVVLCVPTRLDPAPFEKVAGRLLMLAGDRGLTTTVTDNAAKRLAGSRVHILDGYEAVGWSDVAADRTAELATAMRAFLEGVTAADGGPGASVPRRPTRSGLHAGVSYRIEGQGPALVLLPFFLAPSQWAPILPELAQRFTVVTLGGAHLGGVAALEDRARAPTYQAMFRTLTDLLQIETGQSILDVGCGAGSLDRMLVRWHKPTPPMQAVDVNGFLLAEAAALADAEGLSAAIQFSKGSAVALPFGDAVFDRVFSVTVLEECDADRAIAEILRVTKPGGRIGIIVRAIDLPQWWNVDVTSGLKGKIDVPPQSVSAGGVADASLYARMRRAGLEDLVCFPSLVTFDRPGSPMWRYREDHVVAQLTGAQRAEWQQAKARTHAQGVLVMASPMHCAVGRKV